MEVLRIEREMRACVCQHELALEHCESSVVGDGSWWRQLNDRDGQPYRREDQNGKVLKDWLPCWKGEMVPSGNPYPLPSLLGSASSKVGGVRQEQRTSLMTLKIEDLDEFEGLTADMVRAWLRANGWELAGTGAHQYWRCGSGEVAEALLLTDLSWCIGYIANGHGLSPQSLLREINPRMRAGWPTDEELERHAFWMVRTLSDGGIRVLGAYVAREWKRAGIKVECWPCDQHGNKTRRGA